MSESVKREKTQNAAYGAAFCVVPGAGVEPAPPQWRQDFKSCVSTNSTIRASSLKLRSPKGFRKP